MKIAATFEEAKAERAAIEAEVTAAGKVLRAFPRSSMGLVSDVVATTPEYRTAKARYQTAFNRQRAFNAVFVKRFAEELRIERANRRRSP